MQRRRGRAFAAVGLSLSLALVAAACGDDDGDQTSDTSGGGTEATNETGDQQRGGEIVLGAEQWPECVNPITQCANSSWTHWAIDAHVLPKLMELDPEGNYNPSPVLDGEPELSGEGTDNGSGPFTITYRLNPDAVWDDGTPITSEDVRFTWQAYMGTAGAVSLAGWDQIEDVDASDPQTAVVTFKQPYAAWGENWGGNANYLLKADAFDGRTDLSNEMISDLPFSGGPWVLESFSPTEAVLVPNEAYWHEDRVPLVDRVTLVPVTDTETQVNALLAGEVDAIYPQPSPGIVDQLDTEGIDYVFGAGVTFEGMWFNQGSLKNPNTPLKDPAVREALLYAVDREAILDQVMRPNFPDTEMLNCGGWVPTVGEWCDESDFEDVTYDPAKVASILEGAGWAKGSDGVYAKGGQRLSLTWQTVAGNRRREDIQALVIPAVRQLGIELVTDNSDADTLFQTRLPQMDTEVGLYAQTAAPDPTVSTIMACENIPTPENDFSGQNYLGWCNRQATDLMHRADATPDPDARLELVHQIGDLVREDAVWLPFYQLPLFTAWNSDKLEGPIGDTTNSSYGGFFNVYDWSLRS